ncbi:MAG: hypothetical protein DBW62_04495 [Microbacterium sp.]|nr:MAG: hypothetical protein DBW62_04495 [Microbacterium sp.]
MSAKRRSVAFAPLAVGACVRVDLTHPSKGLDRFDFGEVGRRIYRAAVGIPTGATLQLVVGSDTPTTDLKLPTGIRIQVVAPDAATLRRWLDAISEATQ